MHVLSLVLLAGLAGIGFEAGIPGVQAQVGNKPGAAPDCPYGYYDAAPYDCAPTGYYGPEWFDFGTFTGAGPWFHGESDFHGHVNNRLDPDHGYSGPAPRRGEKAVQSKRIDSAHFQGNEVRDGRGHILEARR